jgi:hypothetical protein
MTLNHPEHLTTLNSALVHQSHRLIIFGLSKDYNQKTGLCLINLHTRS